MHLLGGDELGRAPADLGVVRADDEPVAGAVALDHAHAAARDVRDPRPGGVEPRVERRAVHRELSGGTGAQIGEEEASPQHEHRGRERAIGVVGDDAARGLARPLATRLLCGGLLRGGHLRGLGVRRGEHGVRVGHASHVARADVEHPERVDRVVARGRAQERDP